MPLRHGGPGAEARITAASVPVPVALPVPMQSQMPTQQGFGLLMHETAKVDMPLARCIDSGAAPARGRPAEALLGRLPAHCGLVTVLDGHPATLAWLGAVHGHRIRALGVERLGQTGTVGDLYRHHELDAESIAASVQVLTRGRPVRHLRRVS